MAIDKISQKLIQTNAVRPSGSRLVSSQYRTPGTGKAGAEIIVSGVASNSLDDDLPPSHSDMPPPVEEGGDLMARTLWLQERLDKLTDLEEAASRLEDIVDQTGDKKAQELLNKIYKLLNGKETENVHKEYEKYDALDVLADGDLDGDGVINLDDPDMDGDGITDVAEIKLGTSYANQDTDYDGISDIGELFLQYNILGYENISATNPDWNNDGIIDGMQLPDSLRKRLPQTATGSGADVGTTEDADGVDTQSEPPTWTQAGPKDQIITLTGEVVFKRQDKDLVIETASGNEIIGGYFGADGKPAKKVYVQGTIDKVTFYNMNSGDLNPVGDENNFVVAGFNFDPPPKQTVSTYDVFDGAFKYTEADGEVIYDAANLAATLQIPAFMNNQEVKKVSMTRDGNDILLVFKDKAGAVLGKTRLKDGVKAVTDTKDVLIKLADNGQMIKAENLDLRLQGGSGDDFIVANGGEYDLGAGNDVFKKEVELSPNEKVAVVHGGDGMDIIQGGSKADQIYGDAGDDMLYLDGGGQGVLMGGSGNDTIAGKVWNGSYIIDGGGGVDMTNVLGINPALGIDIDLKNVTIEEIEKLIAKQGVTPAELEALKEALNKAQLGQAEASEQVRSTVMFGILQKIQLLLENYGENGTGPLYEQAINDLGGGPKDPQA